MAQNQSSRAYSSGLLIQKKGHLQPDPTQKPDLKKISQKKLNAIANNKPLTNGSKILHKILPIRQEEQSSHARYQDDLVYLRRQIDLLQNYDQLEHRMRYESEAFVLHKRRHNLFRGFQKKHLREESINKQERSIIFDHFINRKKPANKNSIKIQKFLLNFLSQRCQSSKSDIFLQFISTKHKIPLEIIQKAIKQQNGHVLILATKKESDIRKIKKYQINMHTLPTLGLTFEQQQKPQDGEAIEEQTKSQQVPLRIYQEEVECFEQRPQSYGYLLTEHSIIHPFQDNKRDIFKISRNLYRLKLQKQSTLKRLAYHCVKQVQKRYTRCVRNQNDYINRAKKLHRQCLMYWRKREKELTQLKKKKQKLQAQLKKRDDEQQQAKKQQKRLQYIMYQSGLYSHFMATKLGVEADHKKELDKFSSLNQKPSDIDEEAALLTVNQIINNKMDNLQQYDKKKDQKLDLSSVDQGRLELVGAPACFIGTLKQYQIKGLRWLNNLFEQGINGILADQMGLGKTIQAIALLGHVSQTKGVWGPFLIIAPNSTLYNWQQQFKKFCPSLRVLPYWGNIKQRKTIRKFFSSKKFTEKSDSPFHVVITSYQLTVTDQKTFKRLKWQFMILDEAQAIKNILSQRWNTLKQFKSRNRLLLTGTPIQNNMAQLWALLNFVMPDLFDSHQLFNQWFSKDIQAHSQDQKQLDQIKIQRLHAILKPFMLRRIKIDVEHQIGKKYQHQILCQMTKRQKLLYQSIKQKLNVKQLFKMLQSKAKVENLMNLVMQLRKVCNHPELFERRPARSPFCFQQVYYYTGCIPIRAGDIKLLSFNSTNPINFVIPKLVYDQIMKYPEQLTSRNKRIVNIYDVGNQINNPTFASLGLTNVSTSQVKLCMQEDPLFTGILLAHWWKRNNYSSSFSTKSKLHINRSLMQKLDPRFKLKNTNQIKSLHQVYIPNAVAPTIEPSVISRSFVQGKELIKNNKFYKFIFQGRYLDLFGHYLPDTLKNNFKGILYKEPSLTYIQIIDFRSLVGDSSKLRQLDRILKQKKASNGKVLIFCQMTRMIDILQDFMNVKKYTFFRLDGASNIADRRDMVNDFQKPQSKIFVFLLSTRAGGLGVTLTAANTVIFYDNDWNPTMDAQATDRAHRIGQNRDVNVYQLVTKGTIQQRIVKRAQQKKMVQTTVYQGASFNFFKKDMILELMVDQFQAEVDGEDKNRKEGNKKKGPKPMKNREEGKQDRPDRLQKQQKLQPTLINCSITS